MHPSLYLGGWGGGGREAFKIFLPKNCVPGLAITFKVTYSHCSTWPRPTPASPGPFPAHRCFFLPLTHPGASCHRAFVPAPPSHHSPVLCLPLDHCIPASPPLISIRSTAQPFLLRMAPCALSVFRGLSLLCESRAPWGGRSDLLL